MVGWKDRHRTNEPRTVYPLDVLVPTDSSFTKMERSFNAKTDFSKHEPCEVPSNEGFGFSFKLLGREVLRGQRKMDYSVALPAGLASQGHQTDWGLSAGAPMPCNHPCCGLVFPVRSKDGSAINTSSSSNLIACAQLQKAFICFLRSSSPASRMSPARCLCYVAAQRQQAPVADRDPVARAFQSGD